MPFYERDSEETKNIISAGHVLYLTKADKTLVHEYWNPVGNDNWVEMLDVHDHIKDWLNGFMHDDHRITLSRFYCLIHFSSQELMVQFKLSHDFSK